MTTIKSVVVLHKQWQEYTIGEKVMVSASKEVSSMNFKKPSCSIYESAQSCEEVWF